MNGTAPPPALHLAQVSKSYGGNPALRDISLDVQPREFVGLLGPNGAGKSTLFQVCTGLFAPDGGKVQLFGLEYGKNSSLILSQLGIVFQTRSLDADITVRANLRFFGGLFGLFGRGLKERVIAVARMMDIEPLLDKPVRSLSGGNQRRAEIARACCPSPRCCCWMNRRPALTPPPGAIWWPMSGGSWPRPGLRSCGRRIWSMRSPMPTASRFWFGER